MTQREFQAESPLAISRSQAAQKHEVNSGKARCSSEWVAPTFGAQLRDVSVLVHQDALYHCRSLGFSALKVAIRRKHRDHMAIPKSGSSNRLYFRSKFHDSETCSGDPTERTP